MNKKRCNCNHCNYCVGRRKYEKHYIKIRKQQLEYGKIPRLVYKEIKEKFQSMEPDEIVFRISNNIPLFS